MGVDARGHELRVDLRAVFEPHADRPAAVGEDRPHGRLAADFDAQIVARRGERRGQPAHAALHIAPHAARPARFAHHVVQQHVGTARRADRQKRADDRVGGERRFEHVALEPAVENRPGRRRSSSSTACGKSAPSSPSARYSLHSFLPSRSFLPMPMCRHSSGSGSGSGADLAQHRLEHRRHALQKRVVARIRRPRPAC